MSIERPRVGLVGLFGRGNLGNDGSLEAVLNYLRDAHPDAVISVRAAKPDRVVERFGVPAFALRWHEQKPGQGRLTHALETALGVGVDAVRTARWVRHQDVVIVPGMGVLETTLPLRPWHTPYLMFLVFRSGRIFGKRTALVSVGANDIKQRTTRRLVVSAARAANYRSFRDAGARDAMGAMGLDVTADAVYPDLAFALPVPQGAGEATAAVGVGIMDYSGDNNSRRDANAVRAHYIETMTRFVLWLVDNGRVVQLLLGDSQDEPVAAEVLADVRARRPELAESAISATPAASLEELMEQLATVESVVATRYHTVLCALKLGKPTLAVGYADKFGALMESFGFPEFSLPANSVSVETLIDRFTALERSAPIAEKIVERTNENRRLLAEQFAELSAATLRADANRAPNYYSKDFWSRENLKYSEPHFRMQKCARIISQLAENRRSSLLDVGCGPATLRELLPPNVEYHGIDIALHEHGPNLVEADLVKSPIRFGSQKFDIVVAQGFFEYVGDAQSRKLDEIAQLLAPGGTFVVSYVNFGHRKPDVYTRYSNVQPIEDFRRDLSRNFSIRKSFPTSYNWSHHEPNRALVRAGNKYLNVNLPFLTPRFAVQYLFVCSARSDDDRTMPAPRKLVATRG